VFFSAFEAYPKKITEYNKYPLKYPSQITIGNADNVCLAFNQNVKRLFSARATHYDDRSILGHSSPAAKDLLKPSTDSVRLLV